MEKNFVGVIGCCIVYWIVLLTLSMVYVIQIRVGKLTCGSGHAITAVAPLCVIVFAALLFYVPSMAYAVIVTASEINQNAEGIKASNVSETPKLAPVDVIRGCFELGDVLSVELSLRVLKCD
ncbi:hypothetical protein Ddye_032668 [Dipteronia dyeriana]|uniref:Uncharacterized protein n=1 Tax=Dipteronia dyeriana TaxID=168575 RepID=A0AAD9WJH9_9ROSI|nr:hypothetical protein Ddye_032668 [Dipteronia dyeriana]